MQGSGSSLGSLSLRCVREELVSSPTLLKRQDSSEIKLADGKVRIFLAIKLINAVSLDGVRVVYRLLVLYGRFLK